MLTKSDNMGGNAFLKLFGYGWTRVHRLAFWISVLFRDVKGFFAPMSRDINCSIPTDFNIEPVNLCNANCIFCGYQYQTRPHSFIDNAFAFRIIDSAKSANVRRIGLTPIVGEPLVNRNLEEIIRYAKGGANPLEVGLTTNGLLLTAVRYRSLVDAGIGNIQISMTYPNEEEYFQIYRNHRLGTLIQNIEDMLDVYRPGECNIGISVRTPRYRWGHSLFERARTAGWVVVKNSFMDDWSGFVAEALMMHGFVPRPLLSKRLPCSMLFSGPHFLSDGRATACGCRDLDGGPDLSLKSESLLADARTEYISGKVENIRELFRSGTAPEICQSCRHYISQYEGEDLKQRSNQLMVDFKAALQDIFSSHK